MTGQDRTGKTGRKSKVLFDSIDLEILELLTSNEPMGVLEVAKRINLTHQNLKTHLEKLLKLNLVTYLEIGSSTAPKNKIELTTIASKAYQAMIYDIYSEAEKIVFTHTELKPFNAFLENLRKAKKITFEKETLAKIIQDLNFKKELKKNDNQKG